MTPQERYAQTLRANLLKRKAQKQARQRECHAPIVDEHQKSVPCEVGFAKDKEKSYNDEDFL